MALPDLWVEGRGSSLNSRWHSSGFYTFSRQKGSQSMPISERACNPQWDLRSRKRFCWLVLDSFEWVLAYLMSCSKEEMCQIGHVRKATLCARRGRISRSQILTKEIPSYPLQASLLCRNFERRQRWDSFHCEETSKQ